MPNFDTASPFDHVREEEGEIDTFAGILANLHSPVCVDFSAKKNEEKKVMRRKLQESNVAANNITQPQPTDSDLRSQLPKQPVLPSSYKSRVPNHMISNENELTRNVPGYFMDNESMKIVSKPSLYPNTSQTQVLGSPRNLPHIPSTARLLQVCPNAKLMIEPCYSRPLSSRLPVSRPGERSNRKRRQRTSPDQLQILEQIFETDKMPNQQKRIRLAEQLGMSSRRIQIWFQNKRAKVKRGSKDGKEDNDELSESGDEGSSTPNSPYQAPSSPKEKSPPKVKPEPQNISIQDKNFQFNSPNQMSNHLFDPRVMNSKLFADISSNNDRPTVQSFKIDKTRPVFRNEQMRLNNLGMFQPSPSKHFNSHFQSFQPMPSFSNNSSKRPSFPVRQAS